MANMRYLFGDLGTGQIIEELSLQSVRIDRKLNDWGNFGCSFKLDQSGKDNTDLLNATLPGKCFLIVERETTPIWGGIVWTRVYQSQAKDVQLTARSWEAYPEKVFIDVDFVRTDIEQRNIFRDLWNLMQSNPDSNIGVTVPSSFPTVLTKSVTVLSNEYKNFLQVMGSIADGNDGFDWTIDTIRQDNVYLKNLRIGYPFLGATDSGGLTFDYPGSITNYYRTESMSSAGTHLFVLGAGEGASMVVGTAVQSDLIANGFKRYDVSIPRKDITDPSLATSIAEQAGRIRRAPMTFIKVFLKADIEPVFGSYGLGDLATLSIIDPRHPTGMTVAARIIAFTYKPASDETVEEVELIFEGDELSG